jgi:ornithine cyclodeaminase/alanine dehydrogenase-like protein (mu-crystallin family)
VREPDPRGGGCQPGGILTVPLLVLSAADVHAALGSRDCADAMRGALTALASGRAQQPLRSVLAPDGAAGLMALMPSYGSAGDGDAGYGLKVICITPANPAAGLDAHQGVVLLFRGDTGEPMALLSAAAVTEIRTAAVSVIATELLARPDADVLAVIGTGIQARAHVRALDGARQLAEIRIAGRDPAKAARLAASLSDSTAAPVRSCRAAAEAVAGASIIVTATSSEVPVLDRGAIEAGAHINAVGACQPHARELDTATVAGGALFADRRESVLAESGDYLLAAADGAIGADHIRAELGEVLLGTAPGRISADEITIFKSLGLAVEDLAAARVAYRKAVDAKAAGVEIGSWISF